MKYFLLCIYALTLSSCSVVMAGSKDTSPIKQEKAKEQLTRKSFEKNISSNVVEEEIFDDLSIITYSLNYDKAAKVRMFMHATLDVFTFGIWELFGTLGEVNTNQTIYYVDISYNNENKITAVDIYKDPENTKSTGDV
ncbi:MAG TPA: hypothetical protein DCL21_01915 [Alphaproteobacteria bacterium]|nr:hypothetical protein [Alphaproteobacteria bacterium]